MLHPYQKGQSGNPNGRPPGSKNKQTREIRELARKLVEAPRYMRSLRSRLNAGDAPQLEIVLWYYAYGKPIDRVAPVNPDGTTYAPGQDAEELIALIADLRIWLAREDESDPSSRGPH